MEFWLGHGGSMVVLGVYFASTLIVGLVAWRYFPSSDPEGYVVGGRGMGWLVAAMTLMATQYSALTFLGFPGTIYRTGLGGYVAITGMYIGVSALYWILFAVRTWKLGRTFGHMTPADTFADFYGSKTVGTVLAALLIATLIPYIQAQIIGIAYLLKIATGDRISFKVGTTAVYLLMITYVFMGGLRAVAWTDTLQGVLLLAGLVVGALAVSYASSGGPREALAKLSEERGEWLTLPGPGNAWTWMYLISFSVSVGLGWPMQPQMWLKMHIPRSANFIRLWPLWVTLSFPLVMGAALLVGLTGQAVKPGLTEREATDTIMLTMLLEHFPPLLGGLVAAAGLAAMMSTVSSQIHSVGASVGRDFVVRWWGHLDGRRQLLLIRASVVAVGLVGLYLSLSQPDVLTKLGVFSAAWAAQAAPPAVAALLGLRWATRWGALAGPLIGSIVLFAVGLYGENYQWQGVYAGLWGLAANAACFVLFSLLTPKARPEAATVTRYRLVGW
ncbi:MAG: sodium:solute symporter family protein [Planctomycetota bacterium]|nr:sodium:solute symporter family protein [Planctomycetota bacterium]